MDDIEIVDTNEENIHNYGFCGYSSEKQEGYRRKIDWLKQRFREGMKFKVLYSETDGSIGFIEYIPGEYAWRAVDAPGYMVIHCIMSVYKKNRGKGYGAAMVNESLKDAADANMNGVAVVTRKGTWMAGKELFLKMGFEVVDMAPPDFELLAKKTGNAVPPRFTTDWEEKLKKYGEGLTIIGSDQCPYVTTVEKYGIKPEVIELKSSKEAQEIPWPFTSFGIVYKGKLVADHPISARRFMNIMEKEVK
jgi:GNAT superfamily N-acetyltransferase